MKFRQHLLPLMVALAPLSLDGQPATRGTVYVGGGANQTGSSIVFGTTLQLPGSLVAGVDVAGEGVMLDNTGAGPARQVRAVSYNTLLGSRVVGRSGGGLLIAGVLGVRQEAMFCPESYFGFRCFGNLPPRIQYAANSGALVMLRIDRAVVGGRVTPASQQIIVGVAF
jgi:hypothetical protein